MALRTVPPHWSVPYEFGRPLARSHMSRFAASGPGTVFNLHRRAVTCAERGSDVFEKKAADIIGLYLESS